MRSELVSHANNPNIGGLSIDGTWHSILTPIESRAHAEFITVSNGQLFRIRLDWESEENLTSISTVDVAPIMVSTAKSDCTLGELLISKNRLSNRELALIGGTLKFADILVGDFQERYEIIRVLGAGGGGVVLLIRNANSELSVLKCTTEEERVGILQEASAHSTAVARIPEGIVKVKKRADVTATIGDETGQLMVFGIQQEAIEGAMTISGYLRPLKNLSELFTTIQNWLKVIADSQSYGMTNADQHDANGLISLTTQGRAEGIKLIDPAQLRYVDFSYHSTIELIKLLTGEDLDQRYSTYLSLVKAEIDSAGDGARQALFELIARLLVEKKQEWGVSAAVELFESQLHDTLSQHTSINISSLKFDKGMVKMIDSGYLSPDWAKVFSELPSVTVIPINTSWLQDMQSNLSELRLDSPFVLENFRNPQFIYLWNLFFPEKAIAHNSNWEFLASLEKRAVIWGLLHALQLPFMYQIDGFPPISGSEWNMNNLRGRARKALNRGMWLNTFQRVSYEIHRTDCSLSDYRITALIPVTDFVKLAKSDSKLSFLPEKELENIYLMVANYLAAFDLKYMKDETIELPNTEELVAEIERIASSYIQPDLSITDEVDTEEFAPPFGNEPAEV